MADSSSHTSTLPELYRLCNALRSSHTLGSTILAQRDPALSVHNNSQPAPENSLPSSTIPLNKQIHPRDRNPWLYATLHGATHILTKTVVAPIERVSLLLQCQNEMLKYGRISSPYKGIKDCFLRTIKHEGLLSLWRGNSINVISPLTSEAYISALVYLKRKGYLSEEVKERPLWNSCLNGMLGTLGLLFIYPLSYAHIRLANDVKAAQISTFSLDSSRKSYGNAASNWKFNGVFDVFKKTLQLEGCVGLYRGYSIACVGAFAYPATQMINYHYREKGKKEKHSYSTVVITGLALLSFPVLTYPLYTICHRMMMTSGESTKYKGASDAVRQIVKHEGVSSLYRGLTAHLLCFAVKAAILHGLVYLIPTRTDKLNKKV